MAFFIIELSEYFPSESFCMEGVKNIIPFL